jgi:heptosyltransferase-2
MCILVRMPNWLGDAVMATPALNNLLRHHAGAEVVLVGSPIVADLFADDPRMLAAVTDDSGRSRPRFAGLWKLARRLRREFGPFDEGWTFQNGFSSRLLLVAAGAKRRIARAHNRWADWLLTDVVRCDLSRHHAEIYAATVNGGLRASYAAGRTAVPVGMPHRHPRPTAGLHPGAAYGNAKRWPSERFAEAAIKLSSRFDLVLFAGPSECELAGEIESRLIRAGVRNYVNLAGRTSVRELAAHLAGLDLLIANDSGPMHLAGALGVPTVAIFGSTDPRVTRPWAAERTVVVRRDLDCSPCHARSCPLLHHACMRDITAEQVVRAALSLMELPRAKAG